MKDLRSLFAVALLAAVLVSVRCLPVPTNGQPSDWDVRGNYSIAYDDQLHFKLDVAGAVREATATGYGNVVDFGTYNGQPLKLDLAAFCARTEVVCPSESLWKQVAVDEQEVAAAQDLHEIQVVDNEKRDLPAGEHAPVVAGLVSHDQQDRFLLGLGASGGGSGNCGALGISLAGGRFTHRGESWKNVTVYRTASGQPCDPDAGGAADARATGSDGALAIAADASLASPPDAAVASAVDASSAGSPDGGGEACLAVQTTQLEWPKGAAVDGIEEGRVLVGWLGACAFGAALVGATLVIETGFTGQRTGDFDPPPYSPAQPVPIEDGGAGGPSDAGARD